MNRSLTRTLAAIAFFGASFVAPGQAGHAFEIFSLGADGKSGGEDNDADIYADKR